MPANLIIFIDILRLMNQVNFTTKGTDEILVIAFSKITLLKFNFRFILATRFSFNPKIIHRHTVDFHWILFPNQKVCVYIYVHNYK